MFDHVFSWKKTKTISFLIFCCAEKKKSLRSGVKVPCVNGKGTVRHFIAHMLRDSYADKQTKKTLLYFI